eukprot:TRINITY_DN4979_c0_g1_i1.p1 TRINITY_DN4979_c0_g1~~TRINITY_DN4979_c0_g1_i1.p1  ORF type:complete len:674 (+),score=182.99 TRINITY_DN4979_c0_g1_i1:260-2281(+)
MAHDAEQLLEDIVVRGTSAVGEQRPGTETWTRTASRLLSAPQRAANRSKGATIAADLVPTVFYARIATRVVDILHRDLSTNADVVVAYMGLMLGKLVAAGAATETATAILAATTGSEQYVIQALKAVPAMSVASAVTALLRVASTAQSAKATLCRLLPAVVSDGSAWLQALLRTMSGSARVNIAVIHVASQVLKSCGQTYVGLGMSAALAAWSDSTLSAAGGVQHHRSIAHAILFCLDGMDQTGVQAHLPQLLSGIQSHMSAPIEVIRKCGMLVAERMAKALQVTSEPLKFDMDFSDILEPIAVVAKELPAPEPISAAEQARLARKHAKRQQAALPDDPDRLILNDESGSDTESDNGDNVSDDEDSGDDGLKAYGLDDDYADLNEAKIPVFYGDIAAVLKGEDHAAAVQCLTALPDAVRSGRPGLDAAASDLISAVFHLGQRQYEDEDLVPQLHAVMVAIGVMVPRTAVPTLVASLDGNFALSDRFAGLAVLMDVAKELAGISVASGAEQKVVVPEPALPANTRRISHAPVQPVTSVNRFVPVCELFFFPVASRMQQADDMLGCKMLDALGLFVQCARNSLQCRVLVAELLSLLLSLRAHPQASVRRSVFRAMCSCVSSVSALHLVEDCPVEMDAMREFAEERCLSDEDELCKSLAAAALGLLAENASKHANT